MNGSAVISVNMGEVISCEFKESKAGKSYAILSVMVTHYKGPTKQEVKSFFPCLAFGYSADDVQGCQNGDIVSFSGTLELDKEQDRQTGAMVIAPKVILTNGCFANASKELRIQEHRLRQPAPPLQHQEPEMPPTQDLPDELPF